MSKNNALLNDLAQAIESVCQTHGLHFYGLNGYQDTDDDCRFRFTISDQARSLNERDCKLLSQQGVPEDKLNRKLLNRNDGHHYRISGINKDNGTHFIVVQLIEDGSEYLIDLPHLNDFSIELALHTS